MPVGVYQGAFDDASRVAKAAGTIPGYGGHLDVQGSGVKRQVRRFQDLIQRFFRGGVDSRVGRVLDADHSRRGRAADDKGLGLFR